jgi:hypothetical protein
MGGEIFANEFASQQVYQYYINKNATLPEMEMFQHKLEKHMLPYVINLETKSKEEFEIQISNISKKQKRKFLYEKYNFVHYTNVLNNSLQNIKLIQKELDMQKIPEMIEFERKFIQKEKDKILVSNIPHKCVFIDNFIPNSADKGKFIAQKQFYNISEQSDNVISMSSIAGINEIVIDFINKRNYVFLEKRTVLPILNEADTLLNSDEIVVNNNICNDNNFNLDK